MNPSLPALLSRTLHAFAGVDRQVEAEHLETALEITWPFSAWLAVLLLVLATAWIVMVYAREPFASRRPLKLLLVVTRCALIALTLFLMLGVVETRYRTDVSDLVVFIDDSLSMAYRDDVPAGESRATRFDRVKSRLLSADFGLLAELKQRYHVRLRWLDESEAAAGRFGSDDDPAAEIRARRPAAAASRIGDRVKQIVRRQRGRPTAALVVFTDGVVTEGASLVDAAQSARQADIPLHFVAVGDEQPPPDLELLDVTASPTVFAGDVLHFDFGIRANGLDRRFATVRLRRVQKPTALAETLAETEVELPSDGQVVRGRLWHRPAELGTVNYVLEVEAVPNEIDTENNAAEKTVVVKTEPLRVLLVQAYPSFEYRFLKQLLQRQRQRERSAVDLDIVLQQADAQMEEIDETFLPVFPLRKEALFAYDVILLGDADPAFLSRTSMEHIHEFVTQRGGGLLMFAGPRWMPQAYVGTPLEPLFPCELSSAKSAPTLENLTAGLRVQPTAMGQASAHMQLNETPAGNVQRWRALPPLYWTIDLSQLKPAAKVLAECVASRTGNGSAQPIICLQYVGAGKVLLHATDETWRWRFRRGDKEYARYWLQTIRFLSRTATGESGGVELQSDRAIYDPGDPVRLRTRFLDERLAPVADDGVRVMLQRKGQRRQAVALSREGAARGIFAAELVDLPSGQYRCWLLTPTVPEGAPTCDFAIVFKDVEQLQVRPAMTAMAAAAEIAGGVLVKIDQTDELVSRLPPPQRVRIESLPPWPLWNAWPLACLFVVLISTEWIIRQRMGLA